MTGGPAVYIGKTNRAILSGDEDVTEWSMEELIRGQRKARNGKWVGRPPKVVPKRVYDELVRRRLSEAGELLESNLVEAVKVLVSLATDPKVESSVRLKAATTVIDRVMGKAPERINVRFAESTPWEEAIKIIFVGENEDVIDVVATEATTEDDDDYDPFGENV